MMFKQMFVLKLPFLQNYVTRLCFVHTGSRRINLMQKMFLTECSTVPCCHHVTTNISATPPTPPSPMPAPESASLTPSSAGRVLLVQGKRREKEDSATAGVHITTALEPNVCLESAQHPPTEKILAPHVHSLPWKPRRRSAVDHVRTSPPILELTPASPVLKTTLTPHVKMSVEQLVGFVDDPYWRSWSNVQLCRRQQLLWTPSTA